ncbi:MAG: CbrC family protein [Erysipelothrix sp.]
MTFQNQYLGLVKELETHSPKVDVYFKLSRMKDNLELNGEDNETLYNIYLSLKMYRNALKLFDKLFDTDNVKHLKQYTKVKGLDKNYGNMISKYIETDTMVRYKNLKYQIPSFIYHPNPLKTGAFDILDDFEVCPVCEKETLVVYSSMPYCIENVEHVCPQCIADGTASLKYNATFAQGAIADELIDNDKKDILFKRTPGYISWQGENWLTCCDDYCAYLGTVGTEELEDMGIADEVISEYEKQDEYEGIRPYLTKDGHLCGYLFQCLHCRKYHLWVDAS